jgi:hypothetical protein
VGSGVHENIYQIIFRTHSYPLLDINFFAGQPSWGIAWYVNDKLIPELYVERGSTYTFVVEGGNYYLHTIYNRCVYLLFLLSSPKCNIYDMHCFR